MHVLSLNRALMGGYSCLVSILRMGMCPVSLGKILCHCVTKETLQSKLIASLLNVTFAVLQGCTHSFHNYCTIWTKI